MHAEHFIISPRLTSQPDQNILSTNAQVHHKLHHALLIMSLVRSLLIWKDPILAEVQQSLMDHLVSPKSLPE